MKFPGKYIIIVCDDPQRSEVARRLFQETGNDAGIDVAHNAHELSVLLKARTPHLIVVHLVSDGERYITYLKTLREDMAIDHVPILVYPVLPDKAEIEKLFGRIDEAWQQGLDLDKAE